MASKNPNFKNKKSSVDSKDSSSSVCRGCLIKFSAVRSPIYLFDDFPDDDDVSTECHTISDIFSNFTSLKIYKFDQISPYICNECYQQLRNFQRFRLNCINSYNQLLKHKALSSRCFVSLELEKSEHEVSIKEEIDDKPAEVSVVTRCDVAISATQRIQNVLKSEVDEENNLFDAFDGNDDDKTNDSSSDLFNTNQNVIPLKQGDEADANRISIVLEPEVDKIIQAYDDKKPRNLKFMCPQCPKGFFLKHRLDAHLRQHEGLKPFVCDKCDKAFTKWSRYKRHYAIKHSETEFPHPSSKCDQKAKETKRSDDTGFEKVNCSVCNKGFTKKHRYEAHLRMHQGLSEYECDICGKEFTKMGTYKRHMQFKHEQADEDAFETYTCGVNDCGKTYTYKGSLRQHIIFYHLKRPKKKWDARNVICDQCGKAFGSRIALKVHLYTHADKSFQCHICSKYYTTPHNLNEHIKRHQGIKNHECNVCGLKTVTTSELRKHMNSHTREREFKCLMCSLVFLTISQMNIHIKVVHHKVKDYHCEHCGQSFGRARTLKHHIMTHTGERPYQCEICHKGFIQITALKTHMRTHSHRKTDVYVTYPEVHQ